VTAPRRCLVAGAGISGLALAHALAARGVEPLVVEADAQVGGKIRSERDDGWLWEHGPAGFIDRDPAVRELLAALDLAPRALPASEAARRRCVASGGRLLEVPTSAAQLVTTPLLPFFAKLRALADFVLPRGPIAAGRDESVAAFARRRLGPTAAAQVFYPLVSGLYAGDPDAISLPASFPWVADLERRHRSLIVGAAREVLAARRRGAGARLLSFEDGVQTLPRAIALRLVERVRGGVEVKRVEPAPGGFRVALVDRGREEEALFPAVALAVPAHAAAPVVAGFAPALADTVGAIPYAPVTLVYAGFRRAGFARPPDAYGFLVPPGEPSRLLGAVFASCVFPARAPAGHELVSCRLGGARHPELAAAGDAALAALVRDELGRYLGAREAPVFLRVVRHRRALPQYTLGHARRLDVIDAAERAHPGLFLTGNAYRGLGIPDCIRNAPPLADRVARHLAQDLPG